MLMLFEKPCGGRIIFIIERFYSRKLTYRSKLHLDRHRVCVCVWMEMKKKHFFIMINIGPFVILIMGKLAQ